LRGRNCFVSQRSSSIFVHGGLVYHQRVLFPT
jgi:hypothetical protein